MATFLELYEHFRGLRGPHPSLGGPLSVDGGSAPPLHIQRRFASFGENFQGRAVPPAAEASEARGARFHTYQSQFSSERVFRALKFNGSRPVWNRAVWYCLWGE